jgi:hypothetical protein
MRTLVLSLCLFCATLPAADGDVHAVSAGGGAPPHDLHVSYGNAAVEGSVLAVRIRFFRSDLEAALARHVRQSTFRLRSEPAVDAVFLEYLRGRLSVEVSGRALEPRLVGSGEDELDREPVWWYTVQFEAPSTLATFRVRNTLLTELFDDQTNIVKFVHFPDERQKTYSFAKGEESFEVRF